jgi:hypothetical protein
MKRIISLAMAALMVCSIANAQTKQIIKDAKKEAKSLKKDGWLVAPGSLPLERQFEDLYSMSREKDESGMPKYILGDAMSPGKTYDAAKMQAIELAKTNLAGLIQTEVTALIESTVGNEQISSDDAESIVSTVRSNKSLIEQSIGRTITVVECYRKLANGIVEVTVRLAYPSDRALQSAKEVIKKKLEEKGEDLHKQLDAIWANM